MIKFTNKINIVKRVNADNLKPILNANNNTKNKILIMVY